MAPNICCQDLSRIYFLPDGIGLRVFLKVRSLKGKILVGKLRAFKRMSLLITALKFDKHPSLENTDYFRQNHQIILHSENSP